MKPKTIAEAIRLKKSKKSDEDFGIIDESREEESVSPKSIYEKLKQLKSMDKGQVELEDLEEDDMSDQPMDSNEQGNDKIAEMIRKIRARRK